MGKVGSLRLRDNDETETEGEVRTRKEDVAERAIARGVSMGMQRSKRPLYPSDISRRGRSILVVLDNEKDKEYLKSEAEKAGLSVSRLATLLFNKALSDIKSGKISLARRETAIEEYTIEENL